MNLFRVFLVTAIVGGLASGSSALESAALSSPAIDWSSLVFAFMGSLVALPLVLGIQVVLGNDKALHRGWSLFLLAASYITSAGVAAIVVSMTRYGLVPHSFLFVLIGLALLIGLVIVKRLFANKFNNGI